MMPVGTMFLLAFIFRASALSAIFAFLIGPAFFSSFNQSAGN